MLWQDIKEDAWEVISEVSKTSEIEELHQLSAGD